MGTSLVRYGVEIAQKQMVIAGIDYSITCPSVCIHDTDLGPLSFDTCCFYFNQDSITKKEAKRRETLCFPNIFWSTRFLTNSPEERYYYLADWALSICLENKVSVAVLEAYALGAKGLIFNIAEATGILKHYLYRNGIQLVLYPPTENKKSFSGKGNANKELMISTFNERNKINIQEHFGYQKEFTGSPISDIVDSYSLLDTYLKGV